jgi:general secretion pathway protein A
VREFRIPYQHEGPGVATVKDYVDALNEYLLRTHAVRQNNVLIIDEAQNLSVDVLEQLRLLTNLETSERKLLQIVLIGQPELRTMLAQPNLKQLAQRVIARYHLGALTEAETAQYVQHRLEVAGLSQAMPFDARTMRRIHRLSHGVPRRINLLCDRALLGAYATGRKSVDNDTLDRAAREVFDEAAVEAASPSQVASVPPGSGSAWLPASLLAVAALLALNLTGRDTPALAEAGAAPAAASSSPAVATPRPPSVRPMHRRHRRRPR